jgi:hypothetical protein
MLAAKIVLTTKGSRMKTNFNEEAFLCLIKLSFSDINLYLRNSKANNLLVVNLGSLKGSPSNP